ncbi:MAG: hypothetical protein ACXACC_11135 [Promethearchaeota archaeon]|jgi:hypothetical protein
MSCPDEVRKNCLVYRLNLGLECWLHRKKQVKNLTGKNRKIAVIVSFI